MKFYDIINGDDSVDYTSSSDYSEKACIVFEDTVNGDVVIDGNERARIFKNRIINIIDLKSEGLTPDDFIVDGNRLCMCPDDAFDLHNKIKKDIHDISSIKDVIEEDLEEFINVE